MTAFSKWKTIGYAVAIFAAGGISGGAIGVYEARLHPPVEQEIAVRILDHLKVKLGLSDDQVVKIHPIVQCAADSIHSIRAETQQRIIKVLDDSYGQVSAILTPDQRAKLDQMKKERREMMERAQQQGHRHPDGSDHDDDHGGSPHPWPSPSSA